MLLKVAGDERRLIPWEAKEKRTKELAIMIDKIPGGHVVAIPLVYFSTIVLDDEHRLIARNRMERPLRGSMELKEAKKIAKFIIDHLE